MDIIIGLLVGCGVSTVVGTGLYRTALEKQRHNEGVRLEKLHQELSQAHESELQKTIASLKTEYAQQVEAKERELKQEYQHQADEREQNYQKQLAAAIAAREEAKKSLLVRSGEAEEAISQMEIKHARELEELKAQILAKSASQPTPSPAISSPPQTVKPIEVQPIESSQSQPTTLPTGHLGQMLEWTYHPDANLRQQVALAIGNAIAGQKVRVESERAIPILGKLSQDPDPAVRCAAVTALAKIDSREAIPYLQRALKDSDSAAIAAASEAIAKFKRHPLKPSKPAPRNAAAQPEIQG